MNSDEHRGLGGTAALDDSVPPLEIIAVLAPRGTDRQRPAAVRELLPSSIVGDWFISSVQ
jgi:hypothetical protein